MPSSDRYHNNHQPIKLDPEKPCWLHPSNARKRSGTHQVPDNPFSGPSCPKREHDAFLHHTMSRPCPVLGRNKLSFEYPYEASKPRTLHSSNEKLIAEFVQAMSDLISRYRKMTSYDSRQLG